MKTLEFKKSIATLLIAFSTVCLSCRKGDTGPAGPAGANGKDGVANIQTSTVIANNSTWTFDSSDNSYMAVLNFPAITQAVLDKGTVQVFIGDGTGNDWLALPFSYGIGQFNYSYKIGQVFIYAGLSDGSIPNNPGAQQFKVVVIPPAAKATQGNTDVDTFKEASQVFKVGG